MTQEATPQPSSITCRDIDSHAMTEPGVPVRRKRLARLIWRQLVHLLSVLVVFAAAAGTMAQDKPPESTAGKAQVDALAIQGTDEKKVDAESINGKIAALQANSEMDSAVKGNLLQIFGTALKSLETAKLEQDKSAELDRATDAVPALGDALSKQIAELKNARPEDFRGQSLEKLKQSLLVKQSELDQVKKQLATLEAEPNRRLQRLSEIPGEISQKDQALETNQQQQQAPPPPNETPQITDAQSTRLASERLQLTAERKRLVAEQKNYQASNDTLQSQIELARLKTNLLQREVDSLQNLIAQNQRNQIDQAVAQAYADRDQAEGALKPIADRNVELAELQRQYSQETQAAVARKGLTETALEEVDRKQTKMKELVDLVGLTDALEFMINKERVDLLRLRQETRPDSKLNGQLNTIRINKFKLQEELTDVQKEASFAKILETIGGPQSPNADFARSLFSRQKKLLSGAITSNEQWSTELATLDSRQRALTQKIDDYLSYIDQRIVWIRSASPLAIPDIVECRLPIRWLLGVDNWDQARRAIRNNLQGGSWGLYAALLASVVLFVLHYRLKQILFESGEVAKKGRCADMRPTWNALLATVLLAMKWPFVILVLGLLIRTTTEDSVFCSAISTGLLRTALLLFPLDLIRNTCNVNGLGEYHFDWPDPARRAIRANLRWFYLIGLPAFFLMWTMETQDQEAWKNTLGRLATLVYYLSLTIVMHQIFRPNGPFFQHIMAVQKESRLFGLRFVVYFLLVGLPLAVAILSSSGYHYTAVIFTKGFNNSLKAMITLAMIGGLMLRWLLMRRRHLAMEEARRIRQQTALVSTSSESAVATEAVSVPSADKPLAELATVNRQARELVVLSLSAVGFAWFFWIWRDALPAVNFLGEQTLWSVSHGETRETVTVGDLFYALLSFVITIVLIRNMPGLLNLAAQKYSTLDTGTRYAATTIVRYIITIIGTIVGLSFLSIPWSQYGWVVAAATVGIGFGLQEIVANFVSGLILLFERPVRVGDWVTIGDTTGVVTRIQMRATTVTNWDNQELIVPNKELITGKLMNWTLSSVVTRLSINVGVAYGSDVKKVHTTLMNVVTSQPEVLESPASTVVLDEFGDSSLNFVIRCFLRRVEDRLEVKHRINVAIENAFKKEGIVIPFPQRDLHLVSGWPQIQKES